MSSILLTQQLSHQNKMVAKSHAFDVSGHPVHHTTSSTCPPKASKYYILVFLQLQTTQSVVKAWTSSHRDILCPKQRTIVAAHHDDK
jgi:hypothetical protein